MQVLTYYNEFDAKAASWLRELIKQGHITKGDVDEDSIVDLKPEHITGHRAHFFAGIGGWDYALKLAGWPKERGVWTGSCPCQPFSAAGQRQGTKDPRHLWPTFAKLIKAKRPSVVFGEQVASNAGRAWLTGVRSDLERMGYEVGAADLCAAGAGAPHIRQRLFWVGHTPDKGLSKRARQTLAGEGSRRQLERPGHDGGLGQPAGVSSTQRQSSKGTGRKVQAGGSSVFGQLEHAQSHGRVQRGPQSGRRGPEPRCGVGRVANAGQAVLGSQAQAPSDEKQKVHRPASWPGGRGGLAKPWENFALLPCLDGKSRRVESGTFPLAHGAPARVGRLRGYGNAIVPQVAAAFIRAFMEYKGIA